MENLFLVTASVYSHTSIKTEVVTMQKFAKCQTERNLTYRNSFERAVQSGGGWRGGRSSMF